MNIVNEEGEAALRAAGLDEGLIAKWGVLQAALREMESVVVAYSGGVDSGFLAFAAHRALGERMLAVTIQSELETPRQFDHARAFAAEAGFPQRVLPFAALEMAQIGQNPPDRCYHCKLSILNRLQSFAAEQGYKIVAEGQNMDDQSDYRPGRQAVRETHTRSPLMEAGFYKAEIRQTARAFGLTIWDLPSAPCLATRFPYGETLSAVEIQKVGQAEAVLHELGFSAARVRVHGTLARIEVPPDRLVDALARREDLLAALKTIGYAYISLDLQGYRLGSFNEGLPH